MENTPPDKPLRKATKASIKSKYDVHARSASATLSVNVGDLKLKTTCTDATLVKGPCLDGIVLGVEKPGFFMIDYDLPKKATRFQFMSSAKISGKQCKLTYIHAQKANMTMLDGSLAFDPSNKLSADYSFMTGSGQLRYSYIHQGDRTFEPAYAFKTNSWNFSLSQKVYGADTLKTSYETSNKRLGLEWTRESKDAGSFKDWRMFHRFRRVLLRTRKTLFGISCIMRPVKVSASVNIDATNKSPKLVAERTWNFEI